MRYRIGTSGLTFQRTNTDVSAVLRVVCTGEYPVEIVVADAVSEKVSIKPTQHYDFSIRPGKISIGAWGGDSYITCYRKSETTLDTCDINGFVNVPSHIDENLYIDGDLQVAGDITASGGISAVEGSFDKNLTVDNVNLMSAVNNANGKLYVGSSAGGAFKSAGTSIGAIPARSMCLTLKFDNDYSVANWDERTQINVIGDLNYKDSVYRGISLRVNSAGSVFLNGGKDTSGAFNITPRENCIKIFNSTSATVIPAGTYRMVCTVTSTNATVGKIFVNSVLKSLGQNSAVTFDNLLAGTGFNCCTIGNFQGTDFTGGYLTCQIFDVIAFNFDMSVTGAPYTIADYQNGKPIPPELCSTTAAQRALVAYANYTIKRNASTTLIKDISGNGNDATIVGDVKGDKDLLVSTFVDELKTQITQQA